MTGRGRVFISGATGYLGRALIPALLERGHAVRALARPGSESRVPRGAEVMLGNALDRASIQPALDQDTTLVHLTGTPKPAPWKGQQFQAVDQVSLHASLEASCHAGIAHLIYVSVAHPAPVMRSYINVRRECEQAIKASGICATILRPWYVLGEAHWWPLGLLPCYKIAEWFPPTRESALRLGLLWRDQMVRGLVWAVENPPDQSTSLDKMFRVLSVPEIRAVAGPTDTHATSDHPGGEQRGIRKITHASAGR